MQIELGSRLIFPGDAFRRLGWFLTPERISWWFLFPLQLYFLWNARWIPWTLCLILSALVLVFRGTINNIRIGFRTRVLQHEQEVRDRSASQCLESLRSGGAYRQPIVVFLRPFAGDKSMRLRDLTSPDGLDRRPIESRLLAGFKGWATTLSLGNGWEGRSTWGEVYVDMPPDVSIGDEEFYKYEGRLFYERFGEIQESDDRWFDTFRLLIDKADLIISVPIEASLDSEKSATIEELLHLITNALARCVFVMPPEQTLFQMRSRPVARKESSKPWIDTTVSDGWERSRAVLAKHGFNLPTFEQHEHDVTLIRYDEGAWHLVGMALQDIPHARSVLRGMRFDL